MNPNRRAFLSAIGSSVVGFTLPAIASACGRRRHRCSPSPCHAFGGSYACPQSCYGQVDDIYYYHCVLKTTPPCLTPRDATSSDLFTAAQDCVTGTCIPLTNSYDSNAGSDPQVNQYDYSLEFAGKDDGQHPEKNHLDYGKKSYLDPNASFDFTAGGNFPNATGRVTEFFINYGFNNHSGQPKNVVCAKCFFVKNDDRPWWPIRIGQEIKKNDCPADACELAATEPDWDYHHHHLVYVGSECNVPSAARGYYHILTNKDTHR